MLWHCCSGHNHSVVLPQQPDNSYLGWLHHSVSCCQAEAEARRQQRWGESSQQRAWSGRYEASLGGRGYGGGRRDFLGYYAMLGLDTEGGLVSEGDVKRAFREAALRWHPDRQKVGMVPCSGNLVDFTGCVHALWGLTIPDVGQTERSWTRSSS